MNSNWEVLTSYSILNIFFPRILRYPDWKRHSVGHELDHRPFIKVCNKALRNHIEVLGKHKKEKRTQWNCDANKIRYPNFVILYRGTWQETHFPPLHDEDKMHFTSVTFLIDHTGAAPLWIEGLLLKSFSSQLNMYLGLCTAIMVAQNYRWGLSTIHNPKSEIACYC